MVGQLRIYTINNGMMESWLKLFNEVLIYKVLESGMEIQSAWVNEEKTKFIHIRTFNNKEEIEEIEAKFYGTDWWKENVDFIRSHHAHREIILIEPVMPS
tara:strand:+ start:395 stop:694 length:300 start_codon:yes stop_codon:yes gene_type:complete